MSRSLFIFKDGAKPNTAIRDQIVQSRRDPQVQRYGTKGEKLCRTRLIGPSKVQPRNLIAPPFWVGQNVPNPARAGASLKGDLDFLMAPWRFSDQLIVLASARWPVTL